MQYPAGFCVTIGEDGADCLSFASFGPIKPGYAYRGQLRVGSTLDEVLAVLGPPDKVVEDRTIALIEDGVLYKNFQGRNGVSTYGRRKVGGIRVWLSGDRVSQFTVRPEPGVP